MKYLLIFVLLCTALYCGCSETTEEPIAEFVWVTPPGGSKIAANSVIILTFSSDPGEVIVPGATVAGSGKTRTVAGPFAAGTLTLDGSWTNGDGSFFLSYTVKTVEESVVEEPVVEEPAVEEPVVEEPKPEIKPPPDLKDLGVCKIGMNVKPGESCTYTANGENILFWVNQESHGCRSGHMPEFEREEIIFGIPVRIKVKAQNINICANPVIEKDNAFQTKFSAKRNDDKSWKILDVP